MMMPKGVANIMENASLSCGFYPAPASHATARERERAPENCKHVLWVKEDCVLQCVCKKHICARGLLARTKWTRAALARH